MSTVAQVASVVEWIGTWIVDPISECINSIPPFEFWGIFPPQIASAVRTVLLCSLIPLFALLVTGATVFCGWSDEKTDDIDNKTTLFCGCKTRNNKKKEEGDDEETLTGTVISVTPPDGLGAPAVGSQYNFRARKPKKT